MMPSGVTIMNFPLQSGIQLLSAAVLIFGQTTSDLVDMSIEQLLEVRISSASRSEKSIRELPAAVYIITREEIERNHYFTLVDALKDIPGIKVSQPGTGTHGEKYLMRGLWGNNYAKILINGAPVCPSAVDGMPIGEQINMRNIERIEIVYGPAAALYGADALSGIINIITFNPDDNVLAADITLGSSGSPLSDHIYSGTRFYSNMTKGDLKINIFGGLSRRSHMNVSQEKGAFADSSLSGDPISIGRLPSESRNIGLELSYHDFHLMLSDMYRADHSSLEQDSRYYIWDNPDLKYGETIRTASLQHIFEFSNIRLTSMLSYLSYRLDNNSAFGMIFYPDPLYKFTGSDDMLFEETAVFSLTDKLEVVGGVSLQYSGAMPKTNDLTRPFDTEEYRPYSTSIPESGVYQSESLGDFGFNPLTYYNFGGFALSTYSDDLLTVTGGIRYDMHSEYENKIDPRIAALVNITRNASIRVSYNQAFRAPNPYKVYNSIAVENTDSSIYYLHLPNKNMDPEKLSAFEGGIRHIFNDNISTEFIGYRNKITALISSRSVALDPEHYPAADRDSSMSDANSEDAVSILNGLDLVLNANNIYKPMRLSVRAFLSYAIGEETLPNGDDISIFRNMPKYLGKLRLSTQPTKNLYLGIDNIYCSEWFARVYSLADLSHPDRKSEAYFIMDVIFNYRFETKNGTFKINFMVNNLFNESYGGFKFLDNSQYLRTIYGGIDIYL